MILNLTSERNIDDPPSTYYIQSYPPTTDYVVWALCCSTYQNICLVCQSVGNWINIFLYLPSTGLSFCLAYKLFKIFLNDTNKLCHLFSFQESFPDSEFLQLYLSTPNEYFKLSGLQINIFKTHHFREAHSLSMVNFVHVRSRRTQLKI